MIYFFISVYIASNKIFLCFSLCSHAKIIGFSDPTSCLHSHIFVFFTLLCYVNIWENTYDYRLDFSLIPINVDINSLLFLYFLSHALLRAHTTYISTFLFMLNPILFINLYYFFI